MRYTDMPPYAPTLMESTRAIGYSIEAAIADIIDNSVAAKAGRVDIDFFPIGEAYISILDDGCGMSEERLISAMQYGSKDPLDEREEYDLGRYGLGMKTASLSQCRILTVITKQNGVVSGAQWNLDHVKKAKSWSLIILDNTEFDKYPKEYHHHFYSAPSRKKTHINYLLPIILLNYRPRFMCTNLLIPTIIPTIATIYSSSYRRK